MKKRNKKKKKFYLSHCYCAWLDLRFKSWKMMASVVSMTSMLEWVQLNRTNRYIISQKEMHKDKGNFLPCAFKKSVSIKNIYPMPQSLRVHECKIFSPSLPFPSNLFWFHLQSASVVHHLLFLICLVFIKQEVVAITSAN